MPTSSSRTTTRARARVEWWRPTPRAGIYAMTADVSAEAFEAAIVEAKAEGNLGAKSLRVLPPCFPGRRRLFTWGAK